MIWVHAVGVNCAKRGLPAAAAVAAAAATAAAAAAGVSGL